MHVCQQTRSSHFNISFSSTVFVICQQTDVNCLHVSQVSLGHGLGYGHGLYGYGHGLGYGNYGLGYGHHGLGYGHHGLGYSSGYKTVHYAPTYSYYGGLHGFGGGYYGHGLGHYGYY
jgi:hypothetical protein